MFFEVSHIQRMGRAVLHLVSSLQGYTAGGLVLARVQVCPAMMGHSPQVLQVTGQFELYAITWEQLAAKAYLLIKYQWSTCSPCIQAETV